MDLKLAVITINVVFLNIGVYALPFNRFNTLNDVDSIINSFFGDLFTPVNLGNNINSAMKVSSQKSGSLHKANNVQQDTFQILPDENVGDIDVSQKGDTDDNIHIHTIKITTSPKQRPWQWNPFGPIFDFFDGPGEGEAEVGRVEIHSREEQAPKFDSFRDWGNVHFLRNVLSMWENLPDYHRLFSQYEAIEKLSVSDRKKLFTDLWKWLQNQLESMDTSDWLSIMSTIINNAKDEKTIEKHWWELIDMSGEDIIEQTKEKATSLLDVQNNILEVVKVLATKSNMLCDGPDAKDRPEGVIFVCTPEGKKIFDEITKVVSIKTLDNGRNGELVGGYYGKAER